MDISLILTLKSLSVHDKQIRKDSKHWWYMLHNQQYPFPVLSIILHDVKVCVRAKRSFIFYWDLNFGRKSLLMFCIQQSYLMSAWIKNWCNIYQLHVIAWVNIIYNKSII